MERLLEQLSFAAGSGEEIDTVAIDAAYVDTYLGELIKDEDLTRYIL
jgi:ATP-dependent HslUV protease ATP-binding subunit HslU